MAGRFVFSASVLLIVLCGTAHAKLSASERRMLKDLNDAAVATYQQDSFTIKSNSDAEATLSFFGMKLASRSLEKEVLQRQLNSDGSVDFYGTLAKTEKAPGEAPVTITEEHVVKGGKWWVYEDGNAGWGQPDPEDPDNLELVGAKQEMEEEATGDGMLDGFKPKNVVSIEKVKSPSDTTECYKAVPSKEALFKEVGADPVIKDMVDKGTYSATFCVDTETGFLASSTMSMEAKGFTMDLEGFMVDVDDMTMTGSMEYIKFGEPVEFPDVTPPPTAVV